MKRLILAGGRPWSAPDGGRRWVEALLPPGVRRVHVAYCLFAEQPAHWPEILMTSQGLIAKYAGDRKISFKTLEHDTFAAVSEWADSIVIVGGDPVLLRAELEQHGDLMQLWDGKIISGSSAGADIMVRRYIYLQDKSIHEGFGWVPVNFVPHWESPGWGWATKDWEWAAAELAGHPGAQPLLCVREGDFVEISVQ